MNPAQHFLTLLLRAYRAVVSPVLTAVFGPMGLGCRYTPTCSEYGLEAVRMHGAVRGSWLAARRVCRCHPWGGCGHDPVPLDPELAASVVPPDVEPRPPAGRNQARTPDATDPGQKYGLTTSEHLS